MKHEDQEKEGMCAVTLLKSHASETSQQTHNIPLIVWGVIKLISPALEGSEW